MPASPRKRLAQRAVSPKEDAASHSMDEYDYLRKPDDEVARAMSALPPLELLVEQAINVPTAKKMMGMTLVLH